jgi:hypothetical protein
MLRISVSDSRRVYGRETRAQNRWLWIGRPVICAIAAPQERHRPAVTDEIPVKRFERGLRSATKGSKSTAIRGIPAKPAKSA